MLARRPSRSCAFKVLNKMLISDIIGFQLFKAKIKGTQQCSDLEVGCVEGTKKGLFCQLYKCIGSCMRCMFKIQHKLSFEEKLKLILIFAVA